MLNFILALSFLKLFKIFHKASNKEAGTSLFYCFSQEIRLQDLHVIPLHIIVLWFKTIFRPPLPFKLLIYRIFNMKQSFSQIIHDISTEKNTVISPDFLVWKFCWKARFLHSFGRIARNYAETVPFRKISIPGNQVKLRYFPTVRFFFNNFQCDENTSFFKLLCSIFLVI